MNKTTWQRVKLGEVAESIVSGGTPLTSKSEYYNGAIPWLNTKEVKNNRIYFTEKTITEFGLANSSAKWIEKDSVIVAMYGATAGKVAINKIPLTTNQACCNITLDANKADYNFIYYTLLNSFEKLEQMTSGAAQQNLNVGLISNFSFSLPPLETQRKIAEILSSFDDKIDLLHRQNKTLESLSLTLFHHTFIENPKRNAWEEKPLSEIAEIKIGRTPPRKEKQWFSTDSKNTKWISIKDMEEKIFIFNTSEFLTAEAINKFKIPIIPPKTIILSFKMTLGRVGITTENMLSNEAIAHFNLYDKYEHFTEYLYLFLKMSKYETLGSTSSIVTAINTSLIKNIKIAIPDKATLNDFQIQAKGFFDKIYNNVKQIQNLESLRDIMLPKLLSGEMEV